MLKSFVFSAETAVVAAELSQIKHLFGFRRVEGCVLQILLLYNVTIFLEKQPEISKQI